MVNAVYLVRHGMREDMEVPDWKKTAVRPHDTPLSENGRRQAHDSAVFLKTAGIHHIFASPFLRTLQTADIIANELGLQVNIEYGFCEFLNPLWFSAHPDIITRREALQTFSTINPDYHSKVNPSFPEQDEETAVYARVKEAIEQILAQFSGTILIVGHGASVGQAGRYFVDPPEGLLTKMCSVNRFEKGEGGWELKEASVDHLSVYFDL